MKYILITLLIFTSLLAQDDKFSVIVKKPFNQALFDITQNHDRSLSAVGYVTEYKTNPNQQRTFSDAYSYLESLSNKSGKNINIVKVGPDAKILLNKPALLQNYSQAVSIIQTPQNGYFIGGYAQNGSLVVTKIDVNANPIFTKFFGTQNYDSMSKLVQLNDGGVLAVGSSRTSRNMHDGLFEQGLGKNDIYITRLSKNGTILWSKKYGTEHDDIGIDAVEAEDGTLIVLAKVSYDINQNILIININENGDKLWLKEYKSDMIVTPHRVIRLRDGNFLLTVSQKSSMEKEQIRLIKFDLQKNILQDKIIHTAYSSAINDIKEFTNGNLMAVGYVKDSYNTDALAMLFDANLNLLRQEHYGGENYDTFNALTILHNSQVAVAGIYTDVNSQESNMWIVKLDQNASMSSR